MYSSYPDARTGYPAAPAGNPPGATTTSNQSDRNGQEPYGRVPPMAPTSNGSYGSQSLAQRRPPASERVSGSSPHQQHASVYNTATNNGAKATPVGFSAPPSTSTTKPTTPYPLAGGYTTPQQGASYGGAMGISRISSGNGSSSTNNSISSSYTWEAPPPATGSYYTSPSPAVATHPLASSSSSFNHNDTANYPHNITLALALFPVLASSLIPTDASSSTTTTLPLTTFLVLAMVWYALDLANFRKGVLTWIWIGALMMTLVTLWSFLTDDQGEESILTTLLEVSVTGLLWVAVACWACLQCQWLSRSSTGAASTSSPLARILHGLVPPVAAAMATIALVEGTAGRHGVEAAARAAPLYFAVTLTVVMLLVGSATVDDGATATSHTADKTTFSGDGERPVHEDHPLFLLSSHAAWLHSALLVMAPALVHVTTCLPRIASSLAGMDDIYDLALAVTLPYLLHWGIHVLHQSKICLSPYGANRNMFAVGTFRSTILPWTAAALASFSLQQRYLIPICHSLSFQTMGTKTPVWLLSTYWFLATLALLIAGWLSGRTSYTTGEPLLGEYQDDVVQLSLSLAGAALGKACGLPWNFIPLPVLGFLGLALWLSTKMLRYLVLFLFVVHSTGFVLFSYRFAGLQETMEIPIPQMLVHYSPTLQVSMLQFGLLVVLSSVVMGLVAGLAVRSSGGWGGAYLRKMDLTGWLLVVYAGLLLLLEMTLLKRPVPTAELVGVERLPDAEDTTTMMLYTPLWVYTTSALLFGAVLALRQRTQSIRVTTGYLTFCLALGKAVAVFLDSSERTRGGIAAVTTTGSDVLQRSVVASGVFLVLVLPRILLSPVHVKSSSRRHRSGVELPAGALRTILVYLLVVLPAALVLAIPGVLFPLASVLADSAGANNSNSYYYSTTPPISQLVACAISVWGLSSLSMLNYYLPDGGGDVWKKLSALAFLVGLGIYGAAPTVGASVGAAEANPYASLSSLGAQIVSRGKSRTGGWGLLCSAMATLLAITGPLGLKERRGSSGTGKDQFLLFRTMIFALLFGGGVSWFIAVINMSEAQWLVLLLTMVSCMSIAFLGTVAAVMGHFLELDDFDEVQQIVKLYAAAAVVFMPLAGLVHLMGLIESSSSTPALGAGGWLSTYLQVCALTAFSFSLAVRSRGTKDERTRAIGNLGCVFAWFCVTVIVYGRFGVAGLDAKFNVTNVLGVPASVLGTFVAALLLLQLEGPGGSASRIRLQRLGSNGGNRSPSFGLPLTNYRKSKAWVPVITSTVAVFAVATLYCILLRGSSFLSFLGDAPIARTHDEVLATIFGSAKAAEEGHDLAALAQKAVSHSKALSLSAKLARSSIWTTSNIIVPMMHLGGLVATIPTIFLFLRHYWYSISVGAAQVIVALPLNAIPILLGRGIPTLTVLAIQCLVIGSMQLMLRKRADQESKMRI